jgi:hypothetical protein
MKLTSIAFAPALAFLMLVANGGAATTQERYPRAALGVYLNWIEPQYGKLAVEGQGMVVLGATLDIELGLVNPFPGATAAAELNWLDLVTLTLSRGDLFAASRQTVADIHCDTSQPSGRTRAVVANEYAVLLSSDESQVYYQCDFDPLAAGVPAGIYTLQARWKLSNGGNPAIKSLSDSLEPSTTQIEIRGVASPDDALDRDLQRATIAIKKRELAEAETLLQGVLQADPNGTLGLMLRGRAREAAGRCRDAQRDWQRLADVMEAGNTTAKSRRQRLVTAEGGRRAAADWRAQARRLGCRQ